MPPALSDGFRVDSGDSRGPRSVLEKYYNTSAGKGTPQDYIDKCQRAGVDALFTQ
ncbi:hypothetical protein [Klebsiella pneumoniae IS39]|nr:hypothetical protein [Klebsiella pneumoniae IS39]